jgi:hypothetical protein
MVLNKPFMLNLLAVPISDKSCGYFCHLPEVRFYTQKQTAVSINEGLTDFTSVTICFPEFIFVPDFICRKSLFPVLEEVELDFLAKAGWLLCTS